VSPKALYVVTADGAPGNLPGITITDPALRPATAAELAAEDPYIAPVAAYVYNFRMPTP
jgi:hypothetical protein